MVAKVDLDRALAIYKQRFADLGGFTFVFVGNVELAKLQPLVETYLGSLPSRGRKERWRDVGVKFPPGLVIRTVEAGSEPKSLVALTMQAPDRWTRDGERDARILSMVLGIKLREVLREDMSGVYGVQVAAGLVREPRPRRSFRVYFGCDPANVAKLRDAVFTEVGKIARSGPDEVYLTKVREQLRRQREVDARTNRWWLGQLREAYYFGEDLTRATDIDAIVGRATRANVQRAARHFFDDRSYVLVVMTPEKLAR